MVAGATMHSEYVRTVGRMGMLNDYVLPDQSFVACPNQDVAHGLGFGSVDDEPLVMQVPDFGDRFWVYALYDARTDQFSELGKAYGSAPGLSCSSGPSGRARSPGASPQSSARRPSW